MRSWRLLGWALAALAAAGVALLILRTVAAGDRKLALSIEALALAAGVAMHALRPLSKRAPRAEQPRATRRSAPTAPEELARLERAIPLAASQASTLHLTVRPLLREIATERLRRHGLELDRDFEAARDLLGEPAWDLVRPDRQPPEQPFAPGMPVAELAAVVDRLERV